MAASALRFKDEPQSSTPKLLMPRTSAFCSYSFTRCLSSPFPSNRTLIGRFQAQHEPSNMGSAIFGFKQRHCKAVRTVLIHCSSLAPELYIIFSVTHTSLDCVVLGLFFNKLSLLSIARPELNQSSFPLKFQILWFSSQFPQDNPFVGKVNELLFCTMCLNDHLRCSRDEFDRTFQLHQLQV